MSCHGNTLPITELYVRNLPVTDRFPSKKADNAKLWFLRSCKLLNQWASCRWFVMVPMIPSVSQSPEFGDKFISLSDTFYIGSLSNLHVVWIEPLCKCACAAWVSSGRSQININVGRSIRAQIYNQPPISFISHRYMGTLLWRHIGGECVSNHQPHDCLLNRLFGHWWKKASKLRVTGLCAGNSPATGENNGENSGIGFVDPTWRMQSHYFPLFCVWFVAISRDCNHHYGVRNGRASGPQEINRLLSDRYYCRISLLKLLLVDGPLRIWFLIGWLYRQSIRSPDRMLGVS